MHNKVILLGKKIGLFQNILLIQGKTEFIIKRKDGSIEREVKKNLIQPAVKYKIAQHLGDGTINFGVDSLFTTNAASGEIGNDGIIFVGPASLYQTAITTLDSGGTGSVNWIKFKGVYTASGTVQFTSAILVQNIVSWAGGVPTYSLYIASQTTNKTLNSGDQITAYWTITIS